MLVRPTTSSTASMSMAALGMPKTTQVASSWAIGRGHRLPHLEQSLGAVAAHAGEDHADRVAPRRLGNRLEHHIHARPMPVHGWPVFDGDLVTGA